MRSWTATIPIGTLSPLTPWRTSDLHAALIVGQPLVVTQERKEGLADALKTIRVTLLQGG